MVLQSSWSHPWWPIALHHNRRMHARWLSFVVWAALAASLAYWALTLMVKGPQAPAMTRSATGESAPADWTRLFAAAKVAETPVESTSSRFQLLGVVAPTAGGRYPGEGVALIAIAGAPPKPVRMGASVDGDLKLIEINRRDVGLGTGNAVTVRLSLAPGAPDVVLAPPPQFAPGGGMAPPPNFNVPQMQPHAGAPGPDGIVPPTAVTGSLPQMPPGDGSANPIK
ncbi:hypothetical protein ACFJIX_11410 [Roseateles sp. UC29_93]|uniref:hypothetical protein n=1 Tax=Roseateles sp. UC29_93 TaxID=3350177 RepID=UPI00366DC982